MNTIATKRMQKRYLTVLDSTEVTAACSIANDLSFLTGQSPAFCGTCQKSVHNLSSLTSVDAAHLIAEHDGRIYVRFIRGSDGKIISRLAYSEYIRPLAATVLSSLAIHFGIFLSDSHASLPTQQQLIADRKFVSGETGTPAGNYTQESGIADQSHSAGWDLRLVEVAETQAGCLSFRDAYPEDYALQRLESVILWLNAVFLALASIGYLRYFLHHKLTKEKSTKKSVEASHT